MLAHIEKNTMWILSLLEKHSFILFAICILYFFFKLILNVNLIDIMPPHGNQDEQLDLTLTQV